MVLVGRICTVRVPAGVALSVLRVLREEQGMGAGRKFRWNQTKWVGRDPKDSLRAQSAHRWMFEEISQGHLEDRVVCHSKSRGT